MNQPLTDAELAELEASHWTERLVAEVRRLRALIAELQDRDLHEAIRKGGF